MYPSNREEIGAGYLGGPFGPAPTTAKLPVRRVSSLDTSMHVPKL